MSVIIPGMNLEHERVEFRPRTVRSSLCCVTDLVVCLSAGILLCISVMCCVLCVGLIISRLHYVNVVSSPARQQDIQPDSAQFNVVYDKLNFSQEIT